MTAFQTWQSQGNKQSLKDVMVYLSPNDTPIYSTLKNHTNVKQTIHEFVRFENPRPTSNGATVQGAAVNYPTLTPEVREINYVQTITEGVKVAWEQINSDNVSGDHMAFRKKVASANWAMKLERSIIFNTGVTGNASTATEMKGLLNGSGVMHYTITVSTTLSETTLNQGIQNVWENVDDTVSGELYAFMDPRIKAYVSRNFLTSVSRNVEESKAKKMFTNLIAYSSDFGTVNLVAHKDLTGAAGGGRILLMAKKAYEIGFKKPPFFAKKEVDQTAEAGVVYGEATLEFLYPKAGVKFVNVSS